MNKTIVILAVVAGVGLIAWRMYVQAAAKAKSDGISNIVNGAISTGVNYASGKGWI